MRENGLEVVLLTVKILWATVDENSTWQSKVGFGSHEPEVVGSIPASATLFYGENYVCR